VFQTHQSCIAASLRKIDRAKVLEHQFPSNIGGAKNKSSRTYCAITFERVVGSGRPAPCGVQNSNAKLIVVPFARKMKSLGLGAKLKVTHTSSTY